MTPDQQRRLWALFAASSQNSLTEAEHSELQSMLRTDKQVRQLWFLHQDVELGLKRLMLVTADDPEPRPDVRRRVDSAVMAAEPKNRVSRSGGSGRRHFGLIRRNTATILAVVMCVCLVVLFRMQFSVSHLGTVHNEHGRQVESTAIDGFTVASPTHGTTFALKDHQGKLIALHFLLKSDCPFCLKLTHDYSRYAETTADVLHLFLKPDGEEEIKAWASQIKRDDLKRPPVVYRDPDARLATKYRIPDGYEFHGQSMHFPALVLIDESGKELFRYVGKDNSDRLAPEEFTTRLALALNQKSSVNAAN